jgi:2-dehydro-3-deoxygluconokinase
LLGVLGAFRAAGGTVVFDPNLRPKLWATPDEMTKAITQAAEVSSTVLPSHEDEAAWFGDADLSATAARYAASGAQRVIVKNGGGPMLAWIEGKTTWHTPEAIPQIVDTTAAGDSFNAGYLAAILRGESTAQAVRAGAALAGKVIQARGALVDLAY